MRRLTALFLPAGLLALFAVALRAQDVPVKSAEISLQPRAVPIEIVTIENRRNSPLVAWEIGLHDARTNGIRTIMSADFTWQVVNPASKNGPIRPREERSIEVELSDGQDVRSASVRLAVFEDGQIEGVGEVIERWLKRRQDRADDAAFWIQAFDRMPTDSEAAGKQYLAAHAAERAAQAPQDPSGIHGRMMRLWHETPQPPGWLFTVVDHIRKEAERQHAALTAPRTKPAVLEAAAPLVVTSRRVEMTNFVPVVKNLRDVPIEAIGLELLDDSGRPRSGVSTDYCGTDASTSLQGGGRIPAGASREFRFGQHLRDATRLPVARVSFVMFDDFVFEGPGAKRDELLRKREHQASEIVFLNSVRAAAAAMAPSERLAFLIAKRAEWTKEHPATGYGSIMRTLDYLIEHAKGGAERVRDTAELTERLERQRQQLLRHLAR